MRDTIKKLVAQENKKNPLTDKEIAEKLVIAREQITILRNELNIPDSRQRREKYLKQEIESFVQSYPNVSNRELTKEINQRGFKVSRYLVTKYLEELSIDKPKDIVIKKYNQKKNSPKDKGNFNEKFENTAFKRLIGASGSLKLKIKQAKASILYPPHGLHTLILGETGVGKSQLAEAMYSFSIESGTLPKKAPFIVFNCADYAENSQLLISHLFGSVKGAYTGSVENREGLVEQANGGILFLDEIHRLPPEGQEILFYLIDKGEYRRLGETGTSKKANVLLIAATTENPESILLSTFRRRIPMVIEIPSLGQRPLQERFRIIETFFGYESTQMKAPIRVDADVIRAYLLYDCPGNVGQLRSDIQVSCAKSFLNYVVEKQDCIHIDVNELSPMIKKGLLKIKNRRNEIDKIIWKDLEFHPKQYENEYRMESDVYSFPIEFYDNMQMKYDQYTRQGLQAHEINKLMGTQIEKMFHDAVKRVKNNPNPISTEELSHIVGDEIIYIVNQIMTIAEESLGKVDPSIFYCLAIHLQATFRRIKQGQEIINPHLEEIKKEYHKEYQVACDMVNFIKEKWGVILPEDEIGFIALYLKTSSVHKEQEGKVGLIIVTHGPVSVGMLDIANKLLNTNHGKAVVMTLEENPQEVGEKIISIAKECDEGKGILMLVDMGSLITMGEVIYEKTGIPVEVVTRVDTVMVIEAVRRSILPGSNLESILYALEDLNSTFTKGRVMKRTVNRKKAIISLCITGEGTAQEITRQMKSALVQSKEEVEFIEMGIIGKRDFHKKIQEMRESKDIIAIIGSINPEYPGIPFIPLQDIFNKKGINQIQLLLDIASPVTKTYPYNEEIYKILKEAKVLLDFHGESKEQVIHQMCQELINNGNVKKEYFDVVMEREKISPIVINREVAMPHGDNRYVVKPAIVVAQLVQPIEWDEKEKVSLIVLLALDIKGKDVVRHLYHQFQNKNILQQMKNATEVDTLKEVLLND